MNKFEFLPAYSPLFHSDKNYFIISGSRASGKSTNAAAYLLVKLMSKEYCRAVVSRYTQKSITNSIYQDLVDLITQWRLGPYLEVKGDSIICKATQNSIITHSMKLADGTMSARSKGLARVNILLIDEATELPSEEEYVKLIDSFREKGVERKIILLFNPTHKNHWIFRRFYLPDGTPNPKWLHNHCFFHTTYKDNAHNLDPTKVREWEMAALTEPDYYEHHLLGRWKDIGAGQIFKTWNWSEYNPDPESEVIYGLDFGFVDPTALIKIQKIGRTLWIQELIYESGLTPQDMSMRMDALGIPRTASVYADSSAPMAIEELQRLGWRNLRKANKGPDSIQTGISKIHSFRVFADPASKNLLDEYYNYAYREGTDKPIDAHNHACDALRYGVLALQDGPRYAAVGRRKPSYEFD